MNIAIGLVTLDPGGAEFQASLLANSLSHRHTVTILTMNKGNNDPVYLNPNIRTLTTPLNYVSRRLSIAHLLTILAHWKYHIHRIKPDITIGFLPYPHMLLSLLSPTKVIGRRCCVWSEMAKYPFYSKVPSFLRMVRKVSGWRTHTVVCNSNTVANDVITTERWERDRIRVIRNGWPTAINRAQDNTRLVYSARRRPEKNHAQLETAAFNLGLKIEFPATTPDWNKGGILIHASETEGCSNSIGMAMSYGWPTVSFNCLGNRELVDGCGVLVPIGDGVGELCKKAQYLQDSHHIRRYISNKARFRIANQYSITRMVDKWESLIKEVA